MVSLWLKSSTSQTTFVDFWLGSSYNKSIFVDFSLISAISINPARDFFLASEFYDLSGDWSIQSSFTLIPLGDFSLIVKYKDNIESLLDFSITSSFLEHPFLDMSFISYSTMETVGSFSFQSSFSGNIRQDFKMKSYVLNNTFNDLFFVSTFKSLFMLQNVSYAFGSSLLCEGVGDIPRIIDLDEAIGFFVNISTGRGELSEVAYDVGHFTMVFDKRLNPAVCSFGVVHVVSLNIFPGHSYVLGHPRAIVQTTLGPAVYSDITLEYQTNTMVDFTSNSIQLEITRTIQEQDYLGFDRFGIGLHVSKYSINKADAKMTIILPHETTLRKITGNKFFNLITLPLPVHKKEAGYLDRLIQLFNVESEISIFNDIHYQYLYQINGYSVGLTKSANIDDDLLFPFGEIVSASRFVSFSVTSYLLAVMSPDSTTTLQAFEDECSYIVGAPSRKVSLVDTKYIDRVSKSIQVISIKHSRISISIITEIIYPFNEITYSSRSDLRNGDIEDMAVLFSYNGDGTVRAIVVDSSFSNITESELFSFGHLNIPGVFNQDLNDFRGEKMLLSWNTGPFDFSTALYRLRVKMINQTYGYYAHGYFSYTDKVDLSPVVFLDNNFSMNMFFNGDDELYPILQIGGVL